MKEYTHTYIHYIHIYVTKKDDELNLIPGWVTLLGQAYRAHFQCDKSFK